MNDTNAVVEIVNIQEALNKGHEPSQNYLFNLIVYSPTVARSHELKEILSRVTEKFPCRIIQIEKNNDPKANEIKVKVSKEKLGKVGREVICDVINIKVSNSQMDRIPFLILPNIVADLPVYLIWGDDPTIATATLNTLQKFSTRLIFNAAWSDNIQNFSIRILELLKTIKIDSMDITWGLLSGWKNLLSKVFDSEEKLNILKNCKKLKISYVYEKPQDEIEAIYLQGFIASSMGWTLAADELQHEHQKALCYRYNNKDINVILDPVKSSDEKSKTISSFELTAKDGNTINLNSLKKGSKVILHVSSDEKCEMPCTFALSDINRGFNFLKEIFYQSTSEHYKEMLQIISKVNWEK